MLVFSATSAREGILYCLHLWLAPKSFGLLTCVLCHLELGLMFVSKDRLNIYMRATKYATNQTVAGGYGMHYHSGFESVSVL